jgi:hypothetical protein
VAPPPLGAPSSRTERAKSQEQKKEKQEGKAKAKPAGAKPPDLGAELTSAITAGQSGLRRTSRKETPAAESEPAAAQGQVAQAKPAKVAEGAPAAECPHGVPDKFAKVCAPDRKCDADGNLVSPADSVCLLCATPGTRVLVKSEIKKPARLWTPDRLGKFSAKLEKEKTWTAHEKEVLMTMAVNWLNESSLRKEDQLWFDTIEGVKRAYPASTLQYSAVAGDVPGNLKVEEQEQRAREGVVFKVEELTGAGGVLPNVWKTVTRNAAGTCELMTEMQVFTRLTAQQEEAAAAVRVKQLTAISAKGRPAAAQKGQVQVPCDEQFEKSGLSVAVRRCLKERRQDYDEECKITNTVCQDCADADLEVTTGGKISASNPKRPNVFPQGYSQLSQKDGVCTLDPSKLTKLKKTDVQTAVNADKDAAEEQAKEAARSAACMSADHPVTVTGEWERPGIKSDVSEKLVDEGIPLKFTVQGDKLATLLTPESLRAWLAICSPEEGKSKAVLSEFEYRKIRADLGLKP